MNKIFNQSMQRLRTACVVLPLLIALICIASTSLSPSFQDRSVLGVPMMLCLWLLGSIIICALTVGFGLTLSFEQVPDENTPIDDTNTRVPR